MAKKRPSRKTTERGRGAPRVEPDASTWRGRFGIRLKELRERKKLTTPELAEALGAGVVTVYEWERGLKTPNVDRLPDIAAALGVKPSDLVPE